MPAPAPTRVRVPAQSAMTQTMPRPWLDRRGLLATGLVLAAVATPGHAGNLSYLEGLLANTPQGGWVQVNTNRFSDAWASVAQGGLPDGSYSNPASIVLAWSSVAWDSVNDQLLLWGGGHANYMGNEMYAWSGDTGLWSRGSLPSRLDRYGATATYFTADDAAPQSAHTYDNNVFAPVNGMFVTFGGAAFNDGGAFTVRGATGDPVIAGPWAWDPQKADPNKVGGTTGSGYLAATEGGEMWTNLRGQWTGNGPATSQIDTSSAYRTENGRDVIYVTGDAGGSGWQPLYRYELGDVRAGEAGRFNRIGVSENAATFQGAAAIDSVNNLYVRSSVAGGNFQGLGVWDLSTLPVDGNGDPTDCSFASATGRCLVDRYISLVDPSGSHFALTHQHGMAFDEATGKLYLWDGRDRGTVWSTEAAFNADGSLATTWVVTRLDSSTTAQPLGDFSTPSYEIGVLGKWQYVPELGAFIALDRYDIASSDAGVWLYKPFAAAIPEPAAAVMMLAGLGLLGGLGRRRRA